MNEAALDPKTAVNVAMSFVNEQFSSGKISNLGLEELERVGDEWRVTVGFSRPWDYPLDTSFALEDPLASALRPARGTRPDRDYKVVRVNAQTGEVLAVKNRE